MTQHTEFSERTITTLAQRVGYRCSNPACRAATAGPHADSHKATLTGEAAHLVAATPDGPRGARPTARPRSATSITPSGCAPAATP
jgi:hypothetical protein